MTHGLPSFHLILLFGQQSLFQYRGAVSQWLVVTRIGDDCDILTVRRCLKASAHMRLLPRNTTLRGYRVALNPDTIFSNRRWPDRQIGQGRVR